MNSTAKDKFINFYGLSMIINSGGILQLKNGQSNNNLFKSKYEYLFKVRLRLAKKNDTYSGTKDKT